MILKIFAFITLLLFISVCSADNSLSDNNKISGYLKKPTGQYGVGFKDFHWINSNACPDFNFDGKNQDDFSPSNINHCHEIIVRIYYPANIQLRQKHPYYQPFINLKKQEILRQVPTIDKKQIEQLSQLKSFAAKNVPVTVGKKFPILLFSPGFSYPAQAYENFITELVSQGYIVVGINTPFINLVQLPNKHVVESTSSMTDDELENKLVPLQAQDLIFTLEKLKKLHNTSILFSSMDLSHVGLFGHSIGARVLADVVHVHPTYFEAAATLDIGIDESGKSLKKFTIPFMHAIAADRKLIPLGADLPPVIFELGKNGYLVGFSPNEDNHSYSSHDNFSDLSTLQYLPAYQTLLIHLKKRFEEGYTLELKSNDPTKTESDKFDKTTYVLIKKDNKWYFSVYENKEKTKDIDVSMVAGLSEALAKLPNKVPKQLSDIEIESIKGVMTELHYILFGKTFLGTGDGWMITNDINTYLVQFFNMYLKGEINPAFDICSILSQNTYIKCGPGMA